MTGGGRFLLDTHAFLWAITDDPRLSETGSTVFLDRENQLLLSLASVWEMSIKASLGKLQLARPLRELISEQTVRLGVLLLPIELAHATAVQHLPFHHRDPFDRLLVAQARCEQLTLVSADQVLDRYDVARVW